MRISALLRVVASLLGVGLLLVVAATLQGLVAPRANEAGDLVFGAALVGGVLGAGILLLVLLARRIDRSPAPVGDGAPGTVESASVRVVAAGPVAAGPVAAGPTCSRCGRAVDLRATGVCEDCSFEMFSEGAERGAP